MRRIIIVLGLALALSGCATAQKLFEAATTVTASVNNPVTPTMLYNVENGMIVAFAALNAYRSSCQQGLIPPSCRAIIARIQAYTRRLPPMIAELRRFVRTNDQVNAIIAYNLVVTLIQDFRAEATASGIALGGA